MKQAKKTQIRFTNWVRFPLIALGLMAFAGHSLALELGQTSTRAVYLAPGGKGSPYIDVAASAELRGIRTLAGDVVTTWEIFGGIEPTPFRIVIPEECFESEEASLQVRFYRGCGVRAVLESPEVGEIEISIQAFTAVLTKRSDYGRLAITAAIDTRTEVGDVAAVVLGTIGGGRQTVSIGRSSAARLPSGIEVFGFDPQPEPPAGLDRF